MAKERGRKGTLGNAPSLKDEVAASLGDGGDAAIWVREDGAICFGNECVVIKPGEGGALDMEVKPDRCGAEAGTVILDHLIKTAGKGVRIHIPAADVTLS